MANRMVDVIKSVWNGRTTTPIADMVALLGSVAWNFASGITVVGTTVAGIINASGKLTVSAGGAAITGGLTVDSITLPSGTPLTAFKQGTFTPVVAGQTTAGVGTYVTQYGSYLKIGRFVIYNLRVQWSAHTGTGSLAITGLPFVASATNFSTGSTYNNSTTGFNGAQTLVSQGGSLINFTPPGGASLLTMQAVGDLLLTGVYEAT